MAELLTDFAAWIASLILWALNGVLWVFKRIIDLMLFALHAIPTPAFFDNIAGFYTTVMASPLGYFLDVCQVEYGFNVLVVSLPLRFLIRRIPVIG